MRKSVIIFINFIIVSSLCYAQKSQQDRIVQEIKSEYESGNIYETEILALKALHSQEKYTSNNLFEIHKYLAFCYVALGKRESAVNEFLELLEIDSDYRFNPKLISPKIIEVFNIALEKYEKSRFEPHISAEAIQIKASMRSLIFPGLGQIHKGEKRKGYILIGAEALSMSALVFFHWQYEVSHDAYLDAVVPDDIENKYERYNLYYKLRNFTAITAAAIYLYSYYDCVYTPSTNEYKSISLRLTPTMLSVRFNF